MGQDEQDLIRACKAGDPAAFAELIRVHKHRLYGFLYAMTMNDTDADELTQETFVRFWNSIATFREGMPVYPWLRQIGHNLVVNMKKQRKFRPLENVLADAPAPTDSGAAELEKQELTVKIREAIDSLDPDKRMVITLRLIEEMSYAEIAQVMGCSIGTVMSRLFRARTELQKKLKEVVV